MTEPAYKGKEPLPLSVYVSARAGDPQAVERLLRYYDNYMNCLCCSGRAKIATTGRGK